jgi:hypothetical protein
VPEACAGYRSETPGQDSVSLPRSPPEALLRFVYNGPVLGDTVQQARCAKGWSIEQLSRRSGVPGRLIREIESRNSSSYVPSEANTILLGEALRTPVGLLLGQRERLFQQVYQLRLRANHPMAASSTLALGY